MTMFVQWLIFWIHHLFLIELRFVLWSMDMWILINHLTFHFTHDWLDVEVIKSRRRSKSDLTIIEFGGIDVRDVKYL